MSLTNNHLSENKSDPNTAEKEANDLKKTPQKDKIKVRKGCKDIWNAYMVDGAIYSPHDIPFCPTTASELPHGIVTWEEAKAIYKKNIPVKSDFLYDAFVCFYMDDYKFDGSRGIWHDSSFALKVLCHFAGAITPDFSTYQDFPEPIKVFNTYRMRAFGYWLGRNGISVINNVRWGTSESWRYCWDGIPENSIVCIGTAGGSPKKLIDRKRFEEGLKELVRVRKPHTILVYGSANYPCFDSLIDQGITVVAYPSHTASAFERRRAR